MPPAVSSVPQDTIFTKAVVIALVLQWLPTVIIPHLPVVYVQPAARVVVVMAVTVFRVLMGISSLMESAM